MDIYTKYATYVREILASGDLETFKSNPNYTYMLEHVSPEFGIQYLK